MSRRRLILLVVSVLAAVTTIATIMHLRQPDRRPTPIVAGPRTNTVPRLDTAPPSFPE